MPLIRKKQWKEGKICIREKEIRVLEVKPHEYPKEFMLENSLEAMQEAVGGLIDIIDLEEDTCILLNDEGKLIGLEGNRRFYDDIIVGNFYICGSDEEGNLTSLTDEQMEKYKEIFYEPQEFTEDEIEETTRIEVITF